MAPFALPALAVGGKALLGKLGLLTGLGTTALLGVPAILRQNDIAFTDEDIASREQYDPVRNKLQDWSILDRAVAPFLGGVDENEILRRSRDNFTTDLYASNSGLISELQSGFAKYPGQSVDTAFKPGVTPKGYRQQLDLDRNRLAALEEATAADVDTRTLPANATVGQINQAITRDSPFSPKNQLERAEKLRLRTEARNDRIRNDDNRYLEARRAHQLQVQRMMNQHQAAEAAKNRGLTLQLQQLVMKGQQDADRMRYNFEEQRDRRRALSDYVSAAAQAARLLR